MHPPCGILTIPDIGTMTLPTLQTVLTSHTRSVSMGWQDPYVGWADRLALATLFVSILLSAKYLQQRRYAKSRGCLSSCRQAPVKDPFIGLDFIYESLFRGTPERGLQTSFQNFAQLGSTYTVSRWTSQAIHTCDSRNIKHILATGFEDFELPKVRVSVLQDLLGTGIFTLDGPSWSRARGLLRPALKRQKTDVLPAILERHVGTLLRRVPRDGTPFDLQPLFFGFTMDVATEFFMGHSICMLGGTGLDKAQQFVDDYMICSEEATKKMHLGPLSHFRFNSAAQCAKKRVFQYVDEYIDRSLLLLRDEDDDNRRNAGGGNFMQVLAASIDNRKALREQVLHILLASRDTTASLLSNLFFMLAKKPGIYAKLREEVLDGAVGTGIPTPDQLKDMRYLKWCVNECKLPASRRPLFMCSTNSWDKKNCGYIPSSLRMPARQAATRPSLVAAAGTETHHYSCERARLSSITSTQCTETTVYSALSPRSLSPSAGMDSGRGGITYPSTVGHACASAVSIHPPS